MTDKEYVGLDKKLRVVIPQKRSQTQTDSDSQTPTKTYESQNFSSTQPLLSQYQRHNYSKRVIVKNYFGRLKNLFRSMNNSYRGFLELFTVFNDIFMALTNFHISIHPLKIEDAQMYDLIRDKKQKTLYIKKLNLLPELKEPLVLRINLSSSETEYAVYNTDPNMQNSDFEDYVEDSISENQ
ncbi:hypothetical protein BB558_000365 [Smittium angustum]|uniref:DDE Tnp4 domain-containing protein n=1 Tax=Smittium angustum TaxID=133377 RepID=A0A2U1JEP3_SMIAN|nr:hypothetical protein BB558_000365 [Smittium angustum]